jgi:hypothetical protein
MASRPTGPCTVTTKTLNLTAMRWMPDDPIYSAGVLGWLTAAGASYHCETGQRNTRPKLVLDTDSGRETCRPGWWILREPDNSFTVLRPELFQRKHSAVAAAPAQHLNRAAGGR